MAEKLQHEALKVFISYSRRNAEIADALVADLEAHGFDVTIDRRDLPYGEEWKAELRDFILASDTVVWLVSPASVGSQWVNWELGVVKDEKKRLLPVVIETTPHDSLPEMIGDLHLLPAEGVFEANAHLKPLVDALESDRGWIKDQTQLGERARDWVNSNYSADRLLRGSALRAAEDWRARQPRKAPSPPTEVLDLLAASERAAKRRQRGWIAGSMLVAAVALLLAGLAGWQWRQAETNAQIAMKNQQEAERQTKQSEQRRLVALAGRAQTLADTGRSPEAALLALELLDAKELLPETAVQLRTTFLKAALNTLEGPGLQVLSKSPAKLVSNEKRSKLVAAIPGALAVYDFSNGESRPAATRLPLPRSNIEKLALSPSTDCAAVLLSDGKIVSYNLRNNAENISIALPHSPKQFPYGTNQDGLQLVTTDGCSMFGVQYASGKETQEGTIPNHVTIYRKIGNKRYKVAFKQKTLETMNSFRLRSSPKFIRLLRDDGEKEQFRSTRFTEKRAINDGVVLKLTKKIDPDTFSNFYVRDVLDRRLIASIDYENGDCEELQLWTFGTRRNKKLKSWRSSNCLFSMDAHSKLLAYQDRQGAVRVDRVGDGKNIFLRALPTAGNVSQIELSRDGKFLLAVEVRGRALVWNLSTGHEVLSIPPKDTVQGFGEIHFVSESKIVAAGPGGELRIFDLRARPKRFTRSDRPAGDPPAAIHDQPRDAEYLLKVLKLPKQLVDKIKSDEYSFIRRHHSYFYLAPDKRLVFQAGNGTAFNCCSNGILWDINKEKRVCSFRSHNLDVKAAAFSTDALVLYTATNDIFRAFSTETCELLYRIPFANSPWKVSVADSGLFYLPADNEASGLRAPSLASFKSLVEAFKKQYPKCLPSEVRKSLGLKKTNISGC